MSAVSATAPAAVIGLGNVLLGDDGFGPLVIERLSAGWDFPADVELIDAGTPGLGLVTYLYEREIVILVDAVSGGGPVGALRTYGGEDLRRLPPKPRVSPHDPAVQETLAIAELSGHGPRVVLLVGALTVPGPIGLGMSAPMRAAATAAAEMIVSELTRRGVNVTARTTPAAVEPWWLHGPGTSTPALAE